MQKKPEACLQENTADRHIQGITAKVFYKVAHFTNEFIRFVICNTRDSMGD